MTERIMNSSIKQPLGVSPNTLLFGTAFSQDKTLLSEIDQQVTDSKPHFIRDYVDTLIDRQSKIIEAAIQSQVATNEENLRKRYSSYRRLPKFAIERHQNSMTIQALLYPFRLSRYSLNLSHLNLPSLLRTNGYLM
jgi:hypothetical protein